MKSKVSVRGQTVIPREIRKSLGITANSVLDWRVQDGVILVYAIPSDPVAASLGLLEGKGTLQEYLEDRGEERRKELAGEQG